MQIHTFKTFLKDNYDVVEKYGSTYQKRQTLTENEDKEISKVFFEHLSKSEILNYSYYLKELNFLYYNVANGLHIVSDKTNFEIFTKYYNVNNMSDYYRARKNMNLYNKPLKFYFDLLIKIKNEDETVFLKLTEYLISLLRNNNELNKELSQFIIEIITQIRNTGIYTII